MATESEDAVKDSDSDLDTLEENRDALNNEDYFRLRLESMSSLTLLRFYIRFGKIGRLGLAGTE
jgi:hypothetical protein